MLALPDNVEHQPYYNRAHSLDIDERQLHIMCYTVELDKNGNPVSQEALDETKRKNLQFWEDYTSGERSRQKPHLDRIVEEILTFQFTPSMLEPENLLRNLEKYTRMGRLLTSLSDLHKQFPWYFEELPDFKKELLADVESMTSIFGTTLNYAVCAHGYDFSQMKYIESEEEAEGYAQQAEIFGAEFRKKAAEYAERRENTLRREAERREAQTEDIRLLNVQVIGKGAYKYGLPSVEQAKRILREQSGLSEEAFSALEETGKLEDIYSCMNMYHMLLGTISADDVKTGGVGNEESVFMKLIGTHRVFIDTAAVLSRELSKSEKPEERSLAGTLGFMAMKAMSYSGMIANLEAEFKYSVTMGDRRTLKTQVDDDEMGAIFEGRHETAYKYRENVTDPEGTLIPVLSQNLRKAVGKDAADDKDLAAIIMTIEAYENFLETAQVPPCVTDEDKAAYPERVEALSNQLLAFNDRITARTICYLDANARSFRKRRICKALEKSVLDRDTNENNFVRVAELSYRLRHNDFSDARFNADYTGVTLSEALRKTVVLSADVSSRDVVQRGDAASVVYITKKTAAEQAVYRRGASYRPWRRLDKRNKDLDEAKGAITGFRTTRGRLIDSHKSSRDVAVRRVDAMLGANVIADASHVSLKLDGAKEVLSTKMEKAEGVEARKLKYSPGFRYDMYYGLPEVETNGENQYLNLAHPETMRQVYWLQVVDAICGSADRHLGNFFVTTDERGALIKLTGIDNDMSFGEGFIPMKTGQDVVNFYQNNPYMMFTPVYEHAFPCIPTEIYEKVMDLTPEKLSRELRGSVRDSELETAVLRLKVLQEHLSHVPKLDIRIASEARQCAQLTEQKVKDLQRMFNRTGWLPYLTMNYFAMLTAK